jgi:hypothetical protein
MRRLRMPIIALAVFAAVMAILFFVTDRGTLTAVSYMDTAIGGERGDPSSVVCEQRVGRTTLVLVRGEGEAWWGTDTGWVETVAVDLPHRTPGKRIDLGSSNARIGYRKSQAFLSWDIGDGGVSGYVQIRSVSSAGVDASYQIIIEAHPEKDAPNLRNRKVVFRGRSTFPSEPRPTEKRYWSLWPK